MSYSPDEPGLSEAFADAVEALLMDEDTVTGIRTTLNRDTLWNGLTPFSADMVFQGDPETMAPIGKAPLWLCVVGNSDVIQGDQTNLDITGGAGYRYQMELAIRVYLNPDAFLSGSPKAQARKREKAISRVCDYLVHAVFNTHEGKSLALESHVFGSDPDVLDQVHVSYINKDFTPKGYAGTQTSVRAAELTLTGYIE